VVVLAWVLNEAGLHASVGKGGLNAHQTRSHDERQRERERPSSQPKLTGSGKCTHGAMAVGGICSDRVMAAANPRGESPSPRRDLRLPHAVCTPAARSGATGPREVGLREVGERTQIRG